MTTTRGFAPYDKPNREETDLAGVEHRDFSAPDETRTPDKTTIELVNVAGGQIGRYTFQPGWRWSECIKPVVDTDSCQIEHIGYCLSGRIHVTHADGTEADVAGGEVYRRDHGHLQVDPPRGKFKSPHPELEYQRESESAEPQEHRSRRGHVRR